MKAKDKLLHLASPSNNKEAENLLVSEYGGNTRYTGKLYSTYLLGYKERFQLSVGPAVGPAAWPI